MNRTEKLISRVAQGCINSKELFSKHPLLVWRLISDQTKGRKLFLEIVSGGNVAVHTTDDNWKNLVNHIKDKICRRFTK